MVNNADAYIDSGNAYAEQGQFDQAFQEYTKAIEVNPQYAMAYHNRGLAYRAIGQPNLAQKDFDKAIALDPQHYCAS